MKGPSSRQYHLVLPDDLIHEVEEWRRKQPEIPTRAEAFRRLVRRGLKADEQKAKK